MAGRLAFPSRFPHHLRRFGVPDQTAGELARRFVRKLCLRRSRREATTESYEFRGCSLSCDWYASDQETIELMRRRRRRDEAEVGFVVPRYTASLDARVPAENIILSHYIAECEKWYVASCASDGRIFTALSATEPNARRAAGLQTLAYLKSRADGEAPAQTEEQILAARAELARELDRVTTAVIRCNEAFPAIYPRAVILIELEAARKLVLCSAERNLLARWVAPPLIFLAGAFAEGVIGAYAEKAMESLTKVLSG